MTRFLLFAGLFVSAGLGLSRPALAQTDGLPPRPTPFRFVNDQAQLMAPADAQKLDNGLRRYAANTGTQVVVVTVPSLGGRSVADYGRALGTAWGVGQRTKNNGIVVLVSKQEHQVTIQPGSGLADVITPAVTSRIIGEMTPGFKQGNYFAGLRTGLNTLMLMANPSSNPDRNQSATTNAAANTSPAAARADNLPAETPPSPAPTTNDPIMAPPVAEPVSSGPGLGTLLVGALLIGAVLWFVLRLFRGRNAAAGNQPATPNFYPNQPNQPNQPSGPGYGNAPSQSSGPGIGGMLATGAAAAAGAYIGNRMASGHDTSGSSLTGDGNAYNNGGAAGAAGTGAASDYFASRDGGNANASPAPDYFSDANPAPADSNDYFSSDDNSSTSDDASSGDTGGGGFDGGSDNSGSW